MAGWTDGKPFQVDAERLKSWKKVKKWFGCLLCCRKFKEGDTARWVYANFSGSSFSRGNFFVCPQCDVGDTGCLVAAHNACEDTKLRWPQVERVFQLDETDWNMTVLLYGDMMFSRRCPTCGRLMKMPEYLGRADTVECSKCGDVPAEKIFVGYAP